MAMCGLADVDWDRKMSCGTSCSTGAFNFGNFRVMYCFVRRPM